MNSDHPFDFDTVIELKGAASAKWDRYRGRDIIPLWLADLDFRSPPAVIAALHERVELGVFGYPAVPPELVEVVLSMLLAAYGWEVRPDWLVWLPGLVTGLNVVCRAAADPGEEVLTAVPVYPPFLSAPILSGRGLNTAPLALIDGRWTFDLSRKGMGLLMATTGISPLLDFLTLVAVVAAVGLAAFRNSRFGWNRPWLGVAGCLFLLYWLLPFGYGAGMMADRRLVPFLFVVALAALKVGRRGRIVAVAAVLVFALRAGEVERGFIDAQQESGRLARSFSVIPVGARVLPVVEPGRRLGYFWAYGVIQRGWLSPCLFHDPGVQPFRLKSDAYAPCGPAFVSMASLDWARIRREADYVWAYDVPEALPSLTAMGQVIFENGELCVFRLKE